MHGYKYTHAHKYTSLPHTYFYELFMLPGNEVIFLGL